MKQLQKVSNLKEIVKIWKKTKELKYIYIFNFKIDIKQKKKSFEF